MQEEIVDPGSRFSSMISDVDRLTPEEQLVGAFLSVRDIPYGGANSPNPFEVLKRNRGTAKGKHTLLRLLLTRLGYEVREFWCRHDFGRLPIKTWPKELAAFKGKSLTGFHDFLKVKIGDKFVTVDATYDKDLDRLGFPVNRWDGKSDMELPVFALEIFPAKGILEEHKQELVSSLPESVRTERKVFLKTLKAWLENERSNMGKKPAAKKSLKKKVSVKKNKKTTKKKAVTKTKKRFKKTGK